VAVRFPPDSPRYRLGVLGIMNDRHRGYADAPVAERLSAHRRPKQPLTKRNG
jgi:hypothetical protein